MSASICKNEPKMSRREFVKTAAAGAAGLALMGLPHGEDARGGEISSLGRGRGHSR